MYIDPEIKKSVHRLLDKGLSAASIARALSGHVSERSITNWATAYKKSRDQG